MFRTLIFFTLISTVCGCCCFYNSSLCCAPTCPCCSTMTGCLIHNGSDIIPCHGDDCECIVGGIVSMNDTMFTQKKTVVIAYDWTPLSIVLLCTTMIVSVILFSIYVARRMHNRRHHVHHYTPL